MEKRIVFKNTDGSVGVIIPSPDWNGSLKELAAKDVPPGLSWRIVTANKLPASRNWRNAWVDEEGSKIVGVDLERAKEAHRSLIVNIARQRIPRDEFDKQDFSSLKVELAVLDLASAQSLEDLYNLWPQSIENRAGRRVYKSHAD